MIIGSETQSPGPEPVRAAPEHKVIRGVVVEDDRPDDEVWARDPIIDTLTSLMRPSSSSTEVVMAQHADLNLVRSALAERQRLEAQTAERPIDQVGVTRGAAIVVGPNVSTSPGVTVVEPGTFAAESTQPGVDLNRVREIFHESQRAQRSGGSVDPKLAVGVTRNSTIVTGADAVGAPGVTRVEPGTFAAMTASERSAYEERAARDKLPNGTVKTDGGWLYNFKTTYGTEFAIFTKWSGTCYQSWLVSPRLEGGVGVHAGHLFSSGQLCLSDTPGHGQPTLEQAYSKSVVWAHGVEVVLAGYDFPFSINNL